MHLEHNQSEYYLNFDPIMNKILLILISITSLTMGCRPIYKQGTFGHDIRLLENMPNFCILKDKDAMIAINGAYQGRVLSSTSKGLHGKNYGWYNRRLIMELNSQNHLSHLSGESRMWFGPEIGKYSIFFDPGKEQIVPNINISPELNNKLFKKLDQTKHSVTYGNDMKIRNANGYIFNIDAKRKISLKSQDEIESDLQIKLNDSISTVAFETETWIKNIGDEQWKKDSGLLAIWDIGCMLTSPNTTVIIPVRGEIDSVTNYFTPLDEHRIQIKDNVVYYKADARYMNKIGIQPENCKDVFGSYSPELNLLNIVKYNFENDSLYVNSQWGHKDPYQGDVINIFNGEVNKALERNWPFYEFESSSSAKELKVGESMYHTQSIYHFEGDEKYLDKIAKQVLGVSLNDVKQVLN